MTDVKTLALSVVSFALCAQPVVAMDLWGKTSATKSAEKAEKQVQLLVNQNSSECDRQAMQLIEQSAAGGADSPRLHLLQGRIYQKDGQEDKAILAYIECLILLGSVSMPVQNDAVQAREALAGIYLKRGSYDEAGGQLKKVLEVNPADNRTRGNLGICLLQLGFYKQSTEEFKKVLSVEPKNFVALYNMGLALSAQNEPGRAASYFMQAVTQGEATREPLLPMALIGLANCYQAQNQMPSALRLLQRAKKLAPASHYPYLAEAQIYEKLKEPGRAIEAVKKAIELNPQDQNCKLALGRILERGGKGASPQSLTRQVAGNTQIIK